MIKGIIFDVDGVLLDSMELWENLGEIYLESIGKKADEKLKEQLSVRSLEEGVEYLISEYQLDGNPQDIMKDINSIMKDYYCEKVLLKEGVEKYLEEFADKNISMIIATSGNGEFVKKALERLDVSHFFTDIVTCTEVKKSKRYPDIYIEAASRIHLKPEEILVFEDSYHAICTVKEAGFKAAVVYDRSNKDKLESIKQKADICILDYEGFDKFWTEVENKF